MESKVTFFFGSTLLSPVADFSGLSIDQVNFLTCQFIAIILGYPFRTLCNPKHFSSTGRHIIEVSIGLCMVIFCFGYQALHLIIQSTLCLVIMRLLNNQHVIIFVIAILYLSCTHIYRQIYDYGGYTLDVTGPLMIMTQKITSLAFSYDDGVLKKDEDLTEDQRQQAVRKMPSLLEYYSYMFTFHGIICGPLCFYNDYIKFITGTNYVVNSKGNNIQQPNGVKGQREDPSPAKVVIKKLTIALICGTLFVFVTQFRAFRMRDKAFFDANVFKKMLIIYLCMLSARTKYYLGWSLAEATNHMAGLGFNGYDSNGSAKWDLIDNVDIFKVECCTSLKVNIDAWNKMTLVWLRRTVYDRMPVQKTLSVFVISAFWHGFYPGYYFMFATAALFTFAAREVRRNVRPYFQTSKHLAFFYDCVTFIATRLALLYLAAPFTILELVPTFNMYKSLYFWMHIVGVIFLFCIPKIRRETKKVLLDADVKETDVKVEVKGH